MLYYREKIILSLLEEFNNSLGKTQLQKYLFIFTRMQQKPSYDFIPYNYGCFSFQASKDLEHLRKDKLVSFGKKWILTPSSKPYKNMLTNEDRQILFKIKKNHMHLSTRNLVRQIYINYPYYTTHSIIKQDMLSNDEQAAIDKILEEQYSLNDATSILFTIGYEGISFETYVNKLIQNNIKVLIDVRKNPFSHKYGFSKNMLSSVVTKLGIKYIHMPELGIVAEKRKKLETQEDYNALFNEYETTLPSKEVYLYKILEYINEYGRVALTCFEKNVEMCHRTRIKNYIINNLQNNTIVVEL